MRRVEETTGLSILDICLVSSMEKVIRALMLYPGEGLGIFRTKHFLPCATYRSFCHVLSSNSS